MAKIRRGGGRPERRSHARSRHALTLLLEDSRNIAARMAAAGYSEDELRGAWNNARQARFTEASGLGHDRLTEAGRNRARSLYLK